MKYSLRNFLLALIVGLVLFGAIGFAVSDYAQDFIVDLFTPNISEDEPEEEDDNDTTTDTDANTPIADSGESMTFLVVTLSQQDKIESAEVVKLKESGNHTVIISLPSNMMMSDKSTLLLLEDMYTTFGLSYVRGMATAYTGLPIDGTFVCYNDNIDEIVSICGKISVNLSDNIPADGKTFRKGINSLNGENTLSLLTAAKKASVAVSTRVRREVLLGIMHAMLKQDNTGRMCIDAQYPELLSYIDTTFPLSEFTNRQNFLTQSVSYKVNSAILPGEESLYEYTPLPDKLDTVDPFEGQPDPDAGNGTLEDPSIPSTPSTPEVNIVSVTVYLPKIEAALNAYKSYR